MTDHRRLLPWQELGIAPTADLPTIRRAYALRLKAIDIERDPDAFQRLRAAYEALLRRRPIEMAVEEKRPPGDFDETASAPEGETAGTAEAIHSALAAGQFETAFALLERASEQGALAFSERAAVETEFLHATAHARALPPELLFAIVGYFDWENALHPMRTGARQDFAVLDRWLDAEHWYRDLTARAAGPFRLRSGQRRFVARQMLRPRPSWYARSGPASWRLMFTTKAIAVELKLFELHRNWVGDRFDPGRIRWCQRCAVPGRAVPAIILVCSSPMLAGGLLANRDPAPALISLAAFMVPIALIFWMRNRYRARRFWSGR
jgi:hypothetical protein